MIIQKNVCWLLSRHDKCPPNRGVARNIKQLPVLLQSKKQVNVVKKTWERI